VRTIISVLLTILITALIALYLVRSGHASDSPSHASGPAENEHAVGRSADFRPVGFDLDSGCDVLQEYMPRQVDKISAPARLIVIA
jgi:hypothetical protein